MRHREPIILAAVVFCAAHLDPGGALAQIVHDDLWVTNGTVNALLATDSTLYLGGTFTQVGPATGAGVGLDAATGAVRWPFPLVTGAVYAVASDGAGGWYLGGAFTAVQHQARSNLAHLDAAGHVT